jgi:hypothetical protein
MVQKNRFYSSFAMGLGMKVENTKNEKKTSKKKLKKIPKTQA